jgi:hypothetical protein
LLPYGLVEVLWFFEQTFQLLLRIYILKQTAEGIAVAVRLFYGNIILAVTLNAEARGHLKAETLRLPCNLRRQFYDETNREEIIFGFLLEHETDLLVFFYFFGEELFLIGAGFIEEEKLVNLNSSVFFSHCLDTLEAAKQHVLAFFFQPSQG